MFCYFTSYGPHEPCLPLPLSPFSINSTWRGWGKGYGSCGRRRWTGIILVRSHAFQIETKHAWLISTRSDSIRMGYMMQRTDSVGTHFPVLPISRWKICVSPELDSNWSHTDIDQLGSKLNSAHMRPAKEPTGKGLRCLEFLRRWLHHVNLQLDGRDAYQ